MAEKNNKMVAVKILRRFFTESCKSDKIEKAFRDNIKKAYKKIKKATGYKVAKKWLNKKVMPFSKGNRKLPKSTYIFNMGTGILCIGRALGLCQCAHCCYTQGAEELYKERVIQYRLLQGIRWAELTACEIAQTIIQASKRSRIHKAQCVRVNEAGEVIDQSDIDKLSDVADELAKEGIPVYIYSTRKDLDWTEISDNLCVNGSGWMPPIKKNGKPAGNCFMAVPEIPEDAENSCGCDCKECDICVFAKGITIYEEIRDVGDFV